MKTMNIIAMCAALVMLILLGTAQVQAGEFLNMWFKNRLFEPNKFQVEQEKRGHVVIYDGMLDVEVNRAMDSQFERLENMMFIRTIVTDDDGQPKVDTETGDIVTEDDDC